MPNVLYNGEYAATKKTPGNGEYAEAIGGLGGTANTPKTIKPYNGEYAERCYYHYHYSYYCYYCYYCCDHDMEGPRRSRAARPAGGRPRMGVQSN